MKITGALLFALLGVMPIEFLHAQVSPDLEARFVGTWRLVSWEHQFEDGTARRDQRSVGYIMYSESGHMCWASMDPNRPEWVSGGSPSLVEALSGITGFAAYCGRAEIHAREGYVLHYVEVDKVPNSVGIIRKRSFEFRGPDQIALTVDPAELSSPLVGMTLVFQRATEAE